LDKQVHRLSCHLFGRQYALDSGEQIVGPGIVHARQVDVLGHAQAEY
jgi:hypothetical protein